MDDSVYKRSAEIIQENFTRRRTPKGWSVYHSTVYMTAGVVTACSESMYHEPDPNHEWVLQEK